MIAIDLSKQEALDADPNTMQQIDFKGTLAQDECKYNNFVCY